MNFVKLGDVCQFTSGGTPSRLVDSYFQGEIPWITGADITGPVAYAARSYISPEALAKSATSVAAQGTVLLVTRTSVGKVAVAGRDIAFSQDITAVKPRSQVTCASYITQMLRIHQPTLERQARGATIRGVTRRDVESLEIPLPPLEEQRRIAAVLDQADELRAKRREALNRLDTLTQSIFHSMFGDPVTNPQNLQRLPLPEVGHLYSGGTPSKALSENWSGDVPWFSPKDIKASFLENSIDHISAKVTETTSLKLLPAKTVVFVVRGMILAHSFPAAMLLRPATINQDLKAIRPTRPIEPEFLLASLQAQQGHAVSLVETAAHGTKKLTADGLSKIYVFDVPKERQQEFARQVSAVERLKETHRKHLAELDALFASLQHRAFKGEL